MTNEHLRPLLDDWASMQVFFKAGEVFARGLIPESVVQIVKMGRMTALSKSDGGVRGIVAGDVFWMLIARTMAKQLGDAVMAATSPHQYALSTRAGCECIAHALQGLTELDPRATVTSIDGVSAFDLISRGAMMTGLLRVEGGSAALPFVRMFYGAPSEYLWEDSCGTVHRIPQGEGGEQGDALMPLLFAVGQHSALEEPSAQLLPGEHLFAFHDDIYMVTMPERVGAVYAIVEEQLRTRARIRIHGGKTKVWNRGGERPAICVGAHRPSPESSSRGVEGVRDSKSSARNYGVGTPLGHVDFIAQHLRNVTATVFVGTNSHGARRTISVVVAPPLCCCTRQLTAPLCAPWRCGVVCSITMRTFGNASGASFTLTLACAVTRSGKPPHCPSFLEGLASEALTV